MNNNDNTLDEYPLRGTVRDTEEDYPPPHKSSAPRSPEQIKRLLAAEEACRKYVWKKLKKESDEQPDRE
jgi:hypothetical protein